MYTYIYIYLYNKSVRRNFSKTPFVSTSTRKRTRISVRDDFGFKSVRERERVQHLVVRGMQGYVTRPSFYGKLSSGISEEPWSERENRERVRVEEIGWGVEGWQCRVEKLKEAQLTSMQMWTSRALTHTVPRYFGEAKVRRRGEGAGNTATPTVSSPETVQSPCVPDGVWH